VSALPDTRRARWAARLAAGLAFASAALSLYWTAGGTVLLDTVGGAIEDLARERSPGAIALRTATVVLKVAAAISPSADVDRHALRWHVLVWDMWFLVWGLALAVAVAAARRP
jgi:hypothetical protein